MRDSSFDLGGANGLSPLQTADLTLEVDGKRLVDRICLTLGSGNLTVIMGPNGAGKSVLLRLLHGLVEPTAGTIRYGGKPLDADIRKRQALVFQRPVLLRRSVAANIDFVIGLGGKRDAGRRDALLDSVGLLDQARQPARLLSGGEQQRLALARALATGPEVLFLDEPTASLDPASTQLIERLVRNVHDEGCKVIFVTHDIAQARRLADDVVFLNRGRLAELSPAHKFFSDPASPAARAYLEGLLEFFANHQNSE